jgi:hypothetical protein
MPRALFLAVFAAGLVHAAVTKVDISERSDLPVAGAERIQGKVHFALDPNNAANKAIVDLDRAPRNAQGMVEFSADLLMVRPKDPAKRNGTLLMEVSNRGHSSLFSLGGGGGTNLMRTAKDVGDPWMLEQGYTLVLVGWEFDLADEASLIRLLDAPVLRGITGPVRSQIQTDKRTTVESLGDRAMKAYVVADPSSGRMTVRDGFDGPRKEIPRADWHFTADGMSVEYPKGFEPGRIYDVVYTGKDPVVAGVGMAALRDYASYTKAQGDAKYTMVYGQSQDGRFLRTFVNDGFNLDEKGKKAYDGVWAHIGGGGLGSFNVRFAQPSRTRWDYPTDLPPFTPDGLLAKSRAQGVAPKLFLTNNSNEYWNSGGSLVHTSTDGKREIPPPADARIYFTAGTQHVSGKGGPNPNVMYPTNDQEIRWFMNAALVAMNDWITRGVEPPPSRYPSLARGELTDLQGLKFPKLAGVRLPAKVYYPRVLDFGPEFLTKGIISIEPPKEGAALTTLIPQVDADGNEIAGIHLPQVSVPLGTYTAWNLRNAKIGAPDATFVNIGSTFPFALTKAERESAGDPRRSIEERYKNEQDFLAKTEAAARELVKQRYVLERDVPHIVDLAKDRWQALTSPLQVKNVQAKK